jgi:hypothetical protein
MIPDPESVRDYRTRLAHLKGNYDEFLLNRAKYHANVIIVDEIVKRMVSNRFSPKIWMNTILKDVEITQGKVKVKINSTYFSDSGFDVAVARERGTKGHMIKPNTARVLSWISAGVRMFSAGHWVSGIKSLRIIRNTIKEKTPELQEAMDKEFEDWMARVFTE